MNWNEKPYHSLDYHLKEQFHEKVYKLALDGGMTCPNRDGTLDNRGCIFCSAGGSGEFAGDRHLSITEQIDAQKALVEKKFPVQKYIAYFQAFTNTYGPLPHLRKIFTEAISHPDVVVLSIATRPDCLGEDVLDLLEELNTIKPVWVELGLQTIHEETARYIRRGYPLSCFETAVSNLHKRNLDVIVHAILGLPGETKEMQIATMKYLGNQSIQGIKLQLLHVLSGTDLAKDYEAGKFPVLTMDEYIALVIECLEVLPPKLVIHRITGDGPKELLLAPLWSTRKRDVLNTIHKEFKKRNTWQGRLYTPQAAFTGKEIRGEKDE